LYVSIGIERLPCYVIVIKKSKNIGKGKTSLKESGALEAFRLIHKREKVSFLQLIHKLHCEKAELVLSLS